MAIKYYDEALTNLISSWIKDPSLKIIKPDESTRLFEMKLDEKKDQPLTLPLISISRDKNIDILEVTKQPKTFDGFNLYGKQIESRLNEKDIIKKSIPLNVIPIKISYNIDIYTRFLAQADEYVRNLLFNLINYPTLKIILPYQNLNIIHESTIQVEPTITDNSDIKEHLISDQFTRFTLKLSIDDAYLFSIPIQPNTILESFEFEVRDRETKEIVEKDEIISQQS